MRGFRFGRLFAAALFLTSGLVVLSAGEVAGQPGKKGSEKKAKKDKGGKEPGGKAVRDLRKAYDKLSELAERPVPGKGAGRVADHARRFYREAVRAYRDDNLPLAGELAAAAHDAARGLDHLRKASIPPAAGLPEPPTGYERGLAALFGPKGPKGKGPPPFEASSAVERGPWSEALEALALVRVRLADRDDAPAAGPERDVFDAAKSAYAQARDAYEAGEYRKAAELARAAEAWSHVGEHLRRGGWAGPAQPPVAPLPKARGREVPPPPLPLKG